MKNLPRKGSVLSPPQIPPSTPTFAPHSPEGVGYLTLWGNVYHQLAGEQPTATGCQFQRKLSTTEQPFGPRKLEVGEEWVSILTPHCWISSASCFVIENLEGRNLRTQPSPEELERLEKNRLLIGIAPVVTSLVREVTHPFSELRAGESLSFLPLAGCSKRYFLRSQQGVTKVTVTIYPE